jgi:hypothetical protein
MNITIMTVEIQTDNLDKLLKYLKKTQAKAAEAISGQYGADTVLLCNRCKLKKATHSHVANRDCNSKHEPFTVLETCCGDCCKKVN